MTVKGGTLNARDALRRYAAPSMFNWSPRVRPMSALRALVVCGLFAAVTLTHAAGPMPKGQAPGWYRMPLGDFEITALSDGTVALPWHELMKAPPARVQALLARQYLKSPVETSVNGYLVNTGSKLVLIDAGAAGLFGPTLGRSSSRM